MQIQNHSAPRPQMQIEGTAQSASASANVAAKPSGAAETQGKQTVGDGYTAAKRETSVQSSPYAKIVRSAEGGKESTGCCLPPPGKLPLGLMTPAQMAKLDEGMAKFNYDETVKRASSDGNITSREQREINDAGREWKKAQTRTQLEEAKEAYQSARQKAVKDGNISPLEDLKLANAEAKIWGLEEKLRGQKAEDRKMVESDRVFNQIDDALKPQGPPRLIDQVYPRLSGEERPIDHPYDKPVLKPNFADFPKLPDFPDIPWLEPSPWVKLISQPCY